MERQIEKLNEYKKAWQDVVDDHEKEINRQHANNILGANWEYEVLSGRTARLEQFKNDYNRIMSELNTNIPSPSSSEPVAVHTDDDEPEALRMNR